MMRSLLTASSGMLAQQTNIDVISNNLANVNTTGFKKSRVDFQSLLYQSIRKPVASTEGFFNPTGIEVGHGVRIAGTLKDYSTGMLQETGNDLDVCIEGSGFFMVELPDGSVGYTRAGNFRIDAEGFLVNSNGYRLLSSQGNVNTTNSMTVNGKTMKYIQPDTDTNTIHISTTGIVATEKLDISSAAAPVIELANFANPAALEAIGSTIYIGNEVSGNVTIDNPTQGNMGALQAGFLESSNVKIVEEMVKLIIAQRAYEINSKSIQTSDELLSMTNNLRR
ncbi:MAG: flagellar basal-body rod protein FlgG [Firmicutes bacterium HGW-Firmicutes-12]|nr:MAG: flagellar basal-body rod protein FlgG [Firmicutes bacterium HGW-Firmicutes-12]